MLLLVTIGLVLVGAVSLVIGFVSNSLPPIYLSIACSVIAGIVLVVFSRMSKRQEAGGPSASGFTPAPSPGKWTPPPPPPAPSYRAPATPPAPTAPEPAASPAPVSSPVTSAVAVEEFPLEGYDTLRVSQILPALDDLDLDELDIVREREEQGKNRTTVLRRIDVLMDEREAQEGAPATGVITPLEPEMGEDDEDDEFIEDDDDDLLDDDVAAVETDRTDVGAPLAAPVDDSFPIPNYDDLPVAQILPLLDELDDEELDMVAEHEEQGKNRAAILDRIDDMFEPLDDQAFAPVVTPAQRAPAKKAPATKKAVKATQAKKAPVRTAAVKKASVKKASVKKAAPVKKPSPVTSTKATKGTKKAAPAKRTPAAVKKAAER